MLNTRTTKRNTRLPCAKKGSNIKINRIEDNTKDMAIKYKKKITLNKTNTEQHKLQNKRNENNNISLQLREILKMCQQLKIGQEKIRKEQTKIQKQMVNIENKINLGKTQLIETKLFEIENKVDANLKHNIDQKLEKKISDFERNVNRQNDNISDVQNKIMSYAEIISSKSSSTNQSEVISEMNKTIEGLKTDLNNKISNEKASAKEHELIKIKKNNVCLFNVPESSETERTKAYQDDINTVNSILQNKIVITKEDIKEFYRKETINKNKPRPIVIKLKTFGKKLELLRLRNLFHKKDSNKNQIFISPDRTPRQQTKHKELLEELKERSKTEEGLMIRNEKIVQKNLPFRQSPQLFWG